METKLSQNLNTPMHVPDIPEDAWEEDDGSSLPGGSDEEFIAKVNQMEGGVPTDRPEPPTMTYAEVVDVTLPVPMDHPTRGELRKAEVRELTGEDEEYLSKGRARHDRINRLVERGTVSLEGEDVDESIVRAMPMGDRDALMVAIRRATYGDDVDLDLICNSCQAENNITVNLATEIETISGEDRAEVPLRKGGVAVIRWPTGEDEAAVQREIEKNRKTVTGAEVNSLLLGRILVSVGGQTAIGEQTARSLPMATRKDIVNFLEENTPGPKLEVEHECVECGAKSPVMLAYEELFR